MINIYNTQKINHNALMELSGINGEILKVVVFCKTKLPTAKITIKTFDEETLCEDYLRENITRFYPKNIINITQEQTHIENYNVSGPISLKVEGLGENEIIEDIFIYYK